MTNHEEQFDAWGVGEESPKPPPEGRNRRDVGVVMVLMIIGCILVLLIGVVVVISLPRGPLIVNDLQTQAFYSTRSVARTATSVSKTRQAVITPTQGSMVRAEPPDGWELVVYDTFEDNQLGWYEGEISNGASLIRESMVSDGVLLWRMEAVGRGLMDFPERLDSYPSYFIQVEAEQINRVDDLGYGFAVKVGEDGYLAFEVTDAGKVRIESRSTRGARSLLWTGDVQGYDFGPRAVAVLVEGSDYTFYVNGEEVTSLTDATFEGTGVELEVSLYDGSFAATYEVEWDNFELYAPAE